MKIVALTGILGYGYSEEALNIAFSEKVEMPERALMHLSSIENDEICWPDEIIRDGYDKSSGCKPVHE